MRKKTRNNLKSKSRNSLKSKSRNSLKSKTINKLKSNSKSKSKSNSKSKSKKKKSSKINKNPRVGVIECETDHTWGEITGRDCRNDGYQICKICRKTRTGTEGRDPDGHNYEWIDDVSGAGGYSKCKICDDIDHTR